MSGCCGSHMLSWLMSLYNLIVLLSPPFKCFPMKKLSQTVIITISVYIHRYLDSNCKSMNICGVHCAFRYYVIARLLNGELTTDEKPFFFKIAAHLVYIFRNKHWVIVVGIFPCRICCVCCGSSSTGMSLCRVVLVQSCVAGAVSQRESPREGGT